MSAKIHHISNKPTPGDIISAMSHLAQVVTKLPHYIFWKDLNLVYWGCNQNFADIAGLSSPEEIVGKSDFDMPWTKAEAEGYRADDRRVIDSGKPEFDIIEPQLQAGGRKAWLVTNKIPLKDSQGHIIGVLGTFEDITQHKDQADELQRFRTKLTSVIEELEQTNEELTTINKELSNANRALEERSDQLRDVLEANKEILGITAHDLKNPLSGIIGLANMVLLDSQEKPGLAYHYVEENIPILKEEAERMLLIVKNLLDKHRQGETAVLRKERVLLNDIVATVLRWNDLQAKSKGIELNYTTCSVIVVDVDVVSIQRALDNYVSNAIKYSPFGTNVFIELMVVPSSPDPAQDQYVKISVRDEGPGLTIKDKEKVFGKMQKLSALPTGGEHSSGLGLFIVKSLVEAHGGRVGVESTEGVGATFWFTLPVRPM